MQKTKQLVFLYVFFGLFALGGLVCGVKGFYTLYSTYRLINEGVKTTGTVIDLNHARGSVAPVVVFKDELGNTLKYHSDYYTNVAPYTLGEEVVVYYNPNDLKDLFLGGDDLRYLAPLIFFLTHGGLGFVMLYRIEKQRRLYKWLQEKGAEVWAHCIKIKEDANRKGKTFTLHCEWTNPVTQVLHQFKLDETYKKPPTALVPGTLVRVLVDSDNPKRYWVDTTSWDG